MKNESVVSIPNDHEGPTLVGCDTRGTRILTQVWLGDLVDDRGALLSPEHVIGAVLGPPEYATVLGCDIAIEFLDHLLLI